MTSVARFPGKHGRSFAFVLGGTFLSLFLIVGSFGCEEGVEPEEVITVDEIIALEAGTVIPEGDSITTGSTISVTASVTTTEKAGTVVLYWHAEEGELSEEVGDTVTWKAPDDKGLYQVSVHASDGDYIGIGVRNFGVGVYTPTATTYYVGGETCSGCHSDTHDDWELTGHADAWAALQASDHAASYCNRCHTVDQYEVEGNSGYDDVPIAKFENVQCENCHGPGSDHASSMNPADITVSFDAATCGSCHTGDHHPTYEKEWERSPHNFDPLTSSHGAASGAGYYANCQGCHEGVAAAIRLAGDLGSFYGGGTDFYPEGSRPDTTERSLSAITCAVCHDPHANPDQNHQIRTVDDVYLVEANSETPVITDGGTGKLCMQCHHARRAPEGQVAEGYAHFGPHANPQADMLAGKSANHGVAESGFTWAQPSHLYVENSCRTCHVHMIPYGQLEEGAVTGHKFEPTVEACDRCHGTITDFNDIMALDDFDGDGAVEGVQEEVQGLMHLLEEALVAAGLDTTGGESIPGALGDTTRSTVLQREAGYNLVYIEDDKSVGVHNPDYAVQLLQQSYKHLTGSFPLNAVPHYGDQRVVGAW